MKPAQRQRVDLAKPARYLGWQVPLPVACIARRWVWRASSVKKRLDEILGIEGQQIADLFADSDVSHGQTQFLGDRHHDPTFCSAVQLGQNDTGDASRLGK